MASCGDAHRRVVRIPLRQAVRNLFGDQRCASRCKTAARKRAVDGERPRLARLMSPTLRPLMGGHRPIGDRRRPMACSSRDSVLGARCIDLSCRSETMRLSPTYDSILRAP